MAIDARRHNATARSKLGQLQGFQNMLKQITNATYILVVLHFLRKLFSRILPNGKHFEFTFGSPLNTPNQCVLLPYRKGNTSRAIQIDTEESELKNIRNIILFAHHIMPPTAHVYSFSHELGKHSLIYTDKDFRNYNTNSEEFNRLMQDSKYAISLANKILREFPNMKLHIHDVSLDTNDKDN